MPVLISVLIEQDHMQDFLCALENSPMAIQVLEFEMSKPGEAVVKPSRAPGANFLGYAGMMGGMGHNMPGAFGGQAAMEQMHRMMAASMPGGRSMEGGVAPGGSSDSRKGVDIRGVDSKEARKKAELLASRTVKHSTFDPYFNIVEMKVYGQVRFYNPPPKEAPRAQRRDDHQDAQSRR